MGQCKRVLLVAVLVLGVFGVSPSATGAVAVRDKIAPWVLAHTADGAEAEFLVVLAEQADLSAAAQLPTKAEKGRYVYETLWRTAQSSQASLLAWLEARGVEYRAYYIVNLIWVKGDADLVRALAARPDVARIEGNPRIQNALPQPVRPLDALLAAAPTAIEPNITYVRAPEVWALGITGQGIVVGGQDTGYEWTHPALKPHYRGWNGVTANHDYNWHDAIHRGGGICGPDSPVPCDDYGHGTHTMGIAVGDDGGANRIGMAPGAQWIGCRNMNVGVGTPATYLECFEFFLAPYPVGGTPAQGDPRKAPDVTNNSWTCPPSEGCSWATLQVAVEAQRAAGIMTVVSAGNRGPECSTITEPPSIYAAAYTVGALTTGTDNVASLSSRGPVMVDDSNRRKPDLVAPGIDVRSSIRGGTYNTMSGTSMAAPHVAGAVALLWSAVPALKNQIAATEHRLNENAFHIASSACSSEGWPNNTYGYGRLDSKAAVEAALAQYGVALAPSGAAQHAGPEQTVSTTFSITNTGMTVDRFSIELTGAQWQASAPQQIGPLSAGMTATLPVTVAVPAEALYGATDSVTVTVSSVGAPSRKAQATLRTSADALYQVQLGPTVLQAGGEIGTAVRHTLTLTNSGNITDAYSLSLAGATWPTTLTPTLLTLPPRVAAPLSVTVIVPWKAFTGESDTVQLTAAGTGVTAHAEITTVALAISCSPPGGVDFGYEPARPVGGKRMIFTATVEIGTPPIDYLWDFADGSPLADGQVVTHTFPTSLVVRPYSVTLTATNPCGDVAVYHVVTVEPYTLYLPLLLRE